MEKNAPECGWSLVSEPSTLFVGKTTKYMVRVYKGKELLEWKEQQEIIEKNRRKKDLERKSRLEAVQKKRAMEKMEKQQHPERFMHPGNFV